MTKKKMRANDERHGTATGYRHGCRKECCRGAMAAEMRYQRRSPVISHGSWGYEKGCRCGVCTAGYKEMRAKRKAKEQWRANHCQPTAAVNLGGLA